MSPAVVDDSNYVIPAGEDEKQRLGAQYVLKKSITGWTSAVPSSVDVSRADRVLDVAAGTCAWILDFASHPDVRQRLNVPGRDATVPPIHLSACDIDLKFLPSPTVTDPLGIATFQQDVTKPFPQELHGTFDLVHMSMLLLCLTGEGWMSALGNCCQILKPGGLLMLEEADPVLYAGVEPPSEWVGGHDLDSCLKNPGWIGKANAIYTRISLESGFIVELSYRLGELLLDAGFAIVESRRSPVPWGRLCCTVKGAAGADLSEYAEFTVTNMKLIFKHLAASLLAKGKLVYPDGTPVPNEEAMMQMLGEVETKMREEGAFSIGSHFVARKV